MGQPEVVRWSEELSVGVLDLDQDHHNILNQINKLIADRASQPRKVLEECLALLASHITGHFFREEGYMEAIGYPGLERHRLKHQEFAGQVVAFANIFRAIPTTELSDEIINFMLNWTTAHILAEDRDYAEFAGTAG